MLLFTMRCAMSKSLNEGENTAKKKKEITGFHLVSMKIERETILLFPPETSLFPAAGIF